MVDEQVNVLGLGGVTSIGRNIAAAAAAARAGVCGFAEHPVVSDSVGEPIRVANAPWLHARRDGVDRYADLLLPSIDEALSSAPAGRRGSRLGLALALPPHRPGRPRTLAREIRDHIESKYPAVFTTCAFFESGHAAGHLALDVAIRELRTGAMDAYLVAAVDSYICPETLEWLDLTDRIHGAGILNNAWGFIPGEGAGALLLATNACCAELSATPHAEVVSVGIGHEKNVIRTDTVCLGEGLTQAFRRALDVLPEGEQVANVFCDLNGEPYRADEYGFTTLRLKNRFRSPTDFIAPADCWGDIGAASALVHSCLAILSHRKGYSKGPLSMVWASSDSSERGAALIRATARSVAS
jgi:3-oxoacyl-[acyl-carrier-protein] synthase I